MIDRIHSSDTQVFINNQRLIGVQSFAVDNPNTFEPLQNFGSHQIYDRILTNEQTVSISMDFVVVDTNPSNNAAQSVQDPFYSFQNSGLISVENFKISSKDLAGEMIFNTGYLTEYSINGSVGDFVKGSVKYECDSYTYNTTNKLTYYSQTSDTGTAFASKQIIISGNSPDSVSSSAFHIQSFSLTAPIQRTAIYRMGKFSSDYRYPNLPANGSLSISMIKNNVTGSDISSLVLDKGTMFIEIKDCANNPKLQYKINNCSLVSISENLGLDDNASVDFNYEFSLNSGNCVERNYI